MFMVLYSKIYGGKNHDLKSDILIELSQYPAQRVNKYLELNNVQNIINSKNIKNTAEFFNKENITSDMFLTGLQTEILKQNPGRQFTAEALLLSDNELLHNYQSGIKIFN